MAVLTFIVTLFFPCLLTCCPVGTPDAFPQCHRNAVLYVDQSCVTSFSLRTCLICNQRHSHRDTDTRGREYYLPDVNLKSILQILEEKYDQLTTDMQEIHILNYEELIVR